MTEKSKTILLDGGMGRQLARMGAPFRQPEWSALALMEAPATVAEAHGQFIAAGAEVITTNSYALVPFHIGEERFAKDGARLVDLCGRLARASRRLLQDVRSRSRVPCRLFSAPIARICSTRPPHPGCFRC